jgi:hypothetical protein
MVNSDKKFEMKDTEPLTPEIRRKRGMQTPSTEYVG